MDSYTEKRLSDLAAEQIADEILSGRIPGGTQLRQMELADSLGLSRIPVREALQTLEAQGLALRLPTKRILAAELDETKIIELYDTICTLEQQLLVSLSRKGILTAFLAGVPESGDPLCFHRALYHSTDNLYRSILLKNAAECYIRHAAAQCDPTALANHMGWLLERLHTGNFAQAKPLLRMYFRLLADGVMQERRNNL